MFKRSHWEQRLKTLIKGDLTRRLSELQAAHVLRQAVGFGARDGSAGGHSSRRPFSRHLHCGPQEVDLFTVDILHVVLRENKQCSQSRLLYTSEIKKVGENRVQSRCMMVMEAVSASACLHSFALLSISIAEFHAIHDFHSSQDSKKDSRRFKAIL